ncbi:hypothetical protein B0T26DRAFT_657286 [Lasiosphaeria miniovina]|uniref:LysM domain-containing protein n=1 Tax=Lasiosphaeria miniovina TaxID=1954250 RepID=A0AA39ZSS9_9PEZI|nr:uncharacterized protein B0T26DRAFT_657286 [Lasiosphaeria miniovina]KAK0703021.1 hypothetical protein B0T26DRAFT_657286 [Lasiosphaeria miniovina]
MSSAVSVSRVPAHVFRDGSSAGLPIDPNITSNCTWWIDLTTSTTCASVIAEKAITLDQFQRWNPPVSATCETLQAGRPYCVEALSELTTAPSSSISVSALTSLQPPQSDLTQSPHVSGLVDNCDAIAGANGIMLVQFLSWNPSVGTTCGGLWAGAYVCVAIAIGGAVPSLSTTLSFGNGVVATLTPTQPGMVTNCQKFAFVQLDDTCLSLASANSITLDQFVEGRDCGGLWLNFNVCIGV